jgi:hypothetical protein
MRNYSTVRGQETDVGSGVGMTIGWTGGAGMGIVTAGPTVLMPAPARIAAAAFISLYGCPKASVPV